MNNLPKSHSPVMARPGLKLYLLAPPYLHLGQSDGNMDSVLWLGARSQQQAQQKESRGETLRPQADKEIGVLGSRTWRLLSSQEL